MQDNGFSYAQQRHALFWLVLFHMLIIASSNYLVQFPFTVTLPNGFEVHSTWGALTFPFIFWATDLTVRIFGQRLARRIVFFVMFPALALSYALSVLFQNGTWVGFASFGRIHTVCVPYRRRQFFGLCGRTDIRYFRVQPAAPPEIVVDCPFFINVCRQCNRHFTFFSA